MIICIIICSINAFTQPVNTYSFDGWFNTKDMLLDLSTHKSGTHSPISAPAIFYLLNSYVLKLFGLSSLQSELYGISIFQNAFFLSACLVFYRMGKMQGIGWHHLPISIFFLVMVQESLLNQCLFSEALLIPMICWALYILACISNDLEHAGPKSMARCIGFGILAGLMISTKPTLAPFLPISLLFLALRERGTKKISRTLGVIAIVSFLVIGSVVVSAYVRTGRMELSRVKGGHLWNSVVRSTPELLENNPQYALLLTEIPVHKLTRMPYWEIRRTLLKSKNPQIRQISENRVVYDSFLYEMIISGIKDKPQIFVSIGLKRLSSNLFLMMGRVGATRSNTLLIPGIRELPPIFNVRSVTDKIMNPIVFDIFTEIYVTAMKVTYGLTALLVLALIHLGLNSSSDSKWEHISGILDLNMLRLVAMYSAMFFAIMYMSFQLVHQNMRMALMLFPFSMMWLSLIIESWMPVFRRFLKKRKVHSI